MRSRKKSQPAAGAPATVSGSLQEEIAMLKAWMHMIEKLADEGKPLGEMLKMLDVLGKSSTRIAALLRAQRELSDDREFGKFINQALSEVIQELEVNEAETR